MSTQSNSLFHTRVSALLNIHRLLPARVVQEAAALTIPLACREGFIRQILGWREFVHHIHELTDGFRQTVGHAVPIESGPGDGGYARWSGHSWNASRLAHSEEGEAVPSHLGAREPLPPAFWGVPSGFACLDQVVQNVWAEGYSHHITRLMVLANLATLLDISPRELANWFWVAYTDAFDWVVEPNVLAMGTYALGDLMTTKPYVSGASYIARMSDYCQSCDFDPRSSCPITSLYCAFLTRHSRILGNNPRLRLSYNALRQRSEEAKRVDAQVFVTVQSMLRAGEKINPQGIKIQFC